MVKRIHKHKIKKALNLTVFYTHQGVSQGRRKLHCGTPFLMVRNLSDFEFFCRFAFADLWKKFRCCFFFSGNLETIHCFMLGCFFSMANCVSHTCFISFFTSSTSAL